MTGKRRWLRGLAFLSALFLLAILAWFFIFTSPESRAFGARVLEWHNTIEPTGKTKGQSIEGTITITQAEGIPAELLNQSAGFSYQWPDKLFIEARVEGESYFLSRSGEEIRINVPHNNLSLRGTNSVPRFSSRPDSVEPVDLPDFSLPVSKGQLRLLPALVRVKDISKNETGTIWEVQPKAFLAEKLGIPTGSTMKFSFAVESKNLRSIQVEDGKDLAVKVELSDLKIGDHDLDWSQWKGADLSENTEDVSLSHLVKFVDVTLSNLNDRIEPLPPETGKRELVARSGKGRLEIWDGTRVLFLQGTPEEMGRQQGELLTEEIHEVANRILYGIGVGSSFGKGRWFFGEIEEAVARLDPFIDRRYLREMDAVAEAAGMDKEEIRLANFFPELFHCTGFAIHGSATVDGKMYHGRVLDYMRGVGLEQNAVVMIVQPDVGNAWVNVGYASFIGTVTAMNEKKIAIGEMGGRGEGNWDGKPMAQLMREVMEKANTIEEAVAIMERGPRTCEYYYVISDGNSGRAVGITATPEKFETIWSGESHPELPHAVEDAVLLSAGDRYEELVQRVTSGHGRFDAASARELMSRPVCMNSNIQSVLFAPQNLDFWVANADSDKVASETRYTKYNLGEMLGKYPVVTDTSN